MQVALAAVAALILAAFLQTIVNVEIGKRRIARLSGIPPIDSSRAPRVSVVIPACNEEHTIAHALRSVLAQDYPDFEVVVINDRSSDHTGDVLSAIQKEHPQLKVVDVRALPPGWLGKNNALNTGANCATGEWLLFADADVVMDTTALSRALAYAVDNQVDHLTIGPRAIVHGFLTNAFLGCFGLMFSMASRPWKVRDPKSREYIGIGAFNMVRRSVYKAIGGHAPIAMRPDDDLKLAKLLKKGRYKSDFLFGTDLLSVEWYHSFGELRAGLMKNFFAVFQYNVALVLAACLGQFVVFVWPFIAVFCTHGITRALYGAVVAAAIAAYLTAAAVMRNRAWMCVSLPLAGLLVIYLILRAAFLTLRNDGINWRGTHYSLDQLRANRY